MPQSPSRPTVKRLFALSGNRCAMPDCTTRLVDRSTGSIVGEVCHINGEKPSAPRYDAYQHDDARHGFDNLILLCNVHHKIIDDNAAAYPAEKLLRLKELHETKLEGKDPIDDRMSEAFATTATSVIGDNQVVQAGSVSGGQVAHTIVNHYSSHFVLEPIALHNKYPHNQLHVARIRTHVGHVEQIELSRCENYGQIQQPKMIPAVGVAWLLSEWIELQLRNDFPLHMYFAAHWQGGIWFVVNKNTLEGEVICHEQRDRMMPPSVTTQPPTTTLVPPPS